MSPPGSGWICAAGRYSAAGGFGRSTAPAASGAGGAACQEGKRLPLGKLANLLWPGKRTAKRFADWFFEIMRGHRPKKAGDSSGVCRKGRQASGPVCLAQGLEWCGGKSAGFYSSGGAAGIQAPATSPAVSPAGKRRMAFAAGSGGMPGKADFSVYCTSRTKEQ